MSVRQLLHDSGIFIEETTQLHSGATRFTVEGERAGTTRYASSFYARDDDHAVNIRVSALENNRFPNNSMLLIFVDANCNRMDFAEGDSKYSFILDSQFIPEAIAIISQGLATERR